MLFLYHGCSILKGSIIGNGSVVGSKSVLTGKIYLANSLLARTPTTVIKDGYSWKRDFS